MGTCLVTDRSSKEASVWGGVAKERRVGEEAQEIMVVSEVGVRSIIGAEKDGVLSVRMLDDSKVDDWCCRVEGGSEPYSDITCDSTDLEAGR